MKIEIEIIHHTRKGSSEANKVERTVKVDGELYYQDIMHTVVYLNDESILRQLENWLFQKKSERRGNTGRYGSYSSSFLRKLRFKFLNFKYKLLYVLR